MTKATHNGTCQVCGNVQAARVGIGRLAKHGYTTTFGFFSGTCRGSDNVALEISRDLLDKTVIDCRDEAHALRLIRADDVKKIELRFAEFLDGRFAQRVERSLTRGQFAMLTNRELWDQGVRHESLNEAWTRLVARKVEDLHNTAAKYDAHADSLNALAEKRQGKKLYPRDNGMERKRLDDFDRYADAVAAAAELKADGWKTRVMGGRQSGSEPFHVTATRKII